MSSHDRPMRIFISATSDDLAEARRVLKQGLEHVNYVPVEQTSFEPDYGDLIQKLTRQIERCDAMIHLAGFRYGAEPRLDSLPPDTPRRSYTQWEYHIARRIAANRKNGFPIYVMLTGEQFPIPDLRPEPDQLRALQAAHRAALMPASAYERIHDHEALARNSRAIQLQMERLQSALAQERQRTHWLLISLGAILLPLSLIAIGGGVSEYACHAPGIAGICKRHGWGGLPTPEQEAEFARFAERGCAGLYEYQAQPTMPAALRTRATSALNARTVTQQKVWTPYEHTRRMQIGLGLATPRNDQASAQADSLDRLRSEAENYCRQFTDSEVYRQRGYRPSPRLEQIELQCEPFRDQVHCAASALSTCLLEQLEMYKIEACHVEN